MEQNPNPNKPQPKKWTTSKMMLWTCYIIMSIVLIYAMYEMHIQKDLSALVVLITGPCVTALAAIIAYCNKSKVENSQGGIVYDVAMRDIDSQCENPISVDETDDLSTE